MTTTKNNLIQPKKPSYQMSKLTGRVFGRLTVTSFAGMLPHGTRGKHRTAWNCECLCGQKTILMSNVLLTGNTTSCGCLQREMAAKRQYKHGQGKHGQRTTEYIIWVGMNKRCINPKTEYFENYGGRGIYVCEGMRSDFTFFLRIAGNRPSTEYSIDRINNDGSYTCGECPHCRETQSPLNIKWSTKKEQMRNLRKSRFITYQNQTKTVAEWAELTRTPYTTIMARLNRGMTGEEIFAGNVSVPPLTSP